MERQIYVCGYLDHDYMELTEPQVAFTSKKDAEEWCARETRVCAECIYKPIILKGKR